jgi:glycosyltransferase involved in cell wall biosynthesis
VNVVAVVPAHDEAATIAATVAAIRSLPEVSRVLVVDDGSSDTTAEEARRAGADVLVLPRNVGKGGALEAGFEAAGDADAVLLLDADLGASAAEARVLVGPVIAGAADMTVAVLPRPKGSGGVGLVKRLARDGIARMGGGFSAEAPLSGQRVLNRSALAAARPLSHGFGAEVAMTIRVLRAGLRVLEVPAAMAHRATGKDVAGFVHRGRQYRDVRRMLRVLEREGR